MKLQFKINYRFLSIILAVFFIAGIALYFAFGFLVNKNIDSSLKQNSKIIANTLSLDTIAVSKINIKDKHIQITPINETHIKEYFADTAIFDHRENEHDNYRMRVFGVHLNNQNYRVELLQSKVETEDLVKLIFYFLMIVFVFIAIILFFLNRWISNSLWKPFYDTLDNLKNFHIDSVETVKFGSSNVLEFNQLNSVLQDMMQKMRVDFRNMKEFTENASHEIQTPITIIKVKLENLLQEESLNAKQREQIQLVYDAASRLSKLNETLLLLSKIENNQFYNDNEIDLAKIIADKLEFTDEIIRFRNITVNNTLSTPFLVKINQYLADILINNLISNAIKHNYNNGTIEISLKNGQLIIANTGQPLKTDPEKMFQRFNKQTSSDNSNGLGLAIAHEICIKSNLTLLYKLKNGIHELIINK